MKFLGEGPVRRDLEREAPSPLPSGYRNLASGISTPAIDLQSARPRHKKPPNQLRISARQEAVPEERTNLGATVRLPRRSVCLEAKEPRTRARSLSPLANLVTQASGPIVT
ncbi:hypothetical protein LY76DRAFT_674759 [Colletotrichum caudatum]|nr:hypothetical protein LY76DRAFT_674759 [Colletotrichum caudatum]